MMTTQSNIYHELPDDRNVSILDWGCGVGNEIDAMSSMGYSNVLGLDIDSRYLRDGVVIVPDSIAWFQEHKVDFDVIIARESVYYISKESQQDLWDAFYVGLRQGGKLVVIAFNGALTSSEWIIQKDYGIKLALNEISLRSLAESAGFTNIQIQGMNVRHRTLKGSIVGFVLSCYRNLSNRMRYVSERGIDPQNPRLYTKSLILVAQKE